MSYFNFWCSVQLVFLLALNPYCWAAEPLPEQTEQLTALEKVALEHQNAGRTKEAIGAWQKLADLQTSVFGETSDQVVESIRRISHMHLVREALPSAREAREDILERVTKQYGEKHWKTITARHELAYVESASRLSVEQRKRLKEANILREKANGFVQRGKYSDAVEPRRQCRETYQAIMGVNNMLFARDTFELAKTHYRLGDWGIAEAYVRRAIELQRKILGENHPEYASSLNILGLVLEKNGDRVEALSSHTKAAEIFKETSGENSQDYLVALHNIAFDHSSAGNLKQAEELYRQIIPIEERLPGKSLIATSTQIELANILKKDKRFDEVEALYRKGVEVREQTLGKEHPDYQYVANLLINFLAERTQFSLDAEEYADARRYCEQKIEWQIRENGESHFLVKRDRLLFEQINRLEALAQEHRVALKAAAEEMLKMTSMQKEKQFEQALAIAQKTWSLRKEHLGESAVETTSSEAWVGEMYRLLEKFDDAEPHCFAVLELRLKVLASDDPYIGTARTNLIVMLQNRAGRSLKSDQYEVAIKDLEKALELTAIQFDEKHYRTTDARLQKEEGELRQKLTVEQRNRLAEADQALVQAGKANVLGNYRQGLEFVQSAYLIRSEVLGPEHLLTVDCLNAIGNNHERIGKLSDAEKSLLDTVRIRRGRLGADHPKTADSILALGSIYRQLGDLRRAEELTTEAADIHRRVSGKQSSSYGSALNQLGIVCKSRNDLARAEMYFREAQTIWKHVFGSKSPQYSVAPNNLGLIYLQQGQFPRAEALFRESIAIRESATDFNARELAVSLSNLGEALEKQNKIPDAIASYQRATGLYESALGKESPSATNSQERTATNLERLINLRLKERDFPSAKAAAEQLITLRSHYFPADDWRLSDARVHQKRIERREALSPDDFKAVTEAEGAITEADRLLKEHKPDEAKERLEKASEQIKGIVGEQDPLFGTFGNRLGNRYLAEKLFDKAELMYRRDLEIRELHHGKQHPQYALCLMILAQVAEAQNDFAAAEKQYQEALELRRKARGNRHADTMDSLNRFALLYEKQARLSLAAKDSVAASNAYRKAVEFKQEQYGKDNWRTKDVVTLLEQTERNAKLDEAQLAQLDEATELVRKGDSLRDHGKSQEAIAAHRTVLDLQQTLLGSDDRRTVATRYALAIDFQFSGSDSDAEKLFLEVLEWRRKSFGNDHPETANVLQSLGRLHFGLLKNYDAAERELSECLEIRRRSQGVTSDAYALALNNLGELAFKMGQFARAEQYGRNAIENLRSNAGEKSASFAQTAKNLGKTYHFIGDYARAEPLLRKALEKYRETRGERDRLVGDTSRELGRLYSDLGDHARAEAAFREAYSIYAETFGEESVLTTNAIVSLGDIDKRQGEFDEAESHYRKAMEIRKNFRGDQTAAYAECLEKLSAVCAARNQFEDAEKFISQALEIRKKDAGENSLAYATCLMELATIKELRDLNQDATVLLRQVLEIRAHHLGRKHPHYAETLRTLGRVEHKLGDVQGAAGHLNQSLIIASSSLLHASDAQSERQQLLMTKSLRGHLDDYLSLALDARLPVDPVYQYVLTWKGAVFARQLHARELRAARKDADPDLLKLYNRLEQVTAQISLSRFFVAEARETADRTRHAQQLEAELESLEADLAKRSADFRIRKAREALTPAQLQATLPEDAALVDFFEIDYRGLKGGQPGSWQAERRVVAFVVRREQPVQMIDLGSAEAIGDAVVAWRGTLLRKNSVAGENDPAMTLRQLVWSPLSEHLNSAKTVLISPDGLLCRLPFAALPGESPNSYLIEERAIALVPVPQLLLELMSTPNEKTEESPALLVLGNVDYGAAPGAGSEPSDSRAAVSGPTRPEFHPLEATAGEILVVKKHFEKRFGAGHAELLEEAEATEQQFRRDAPRHQWVHMATHGFFSSAAPPSIGKARSGIVQDEDPAGQHPGLLSGLALAGANSPLDPTTDDGILTALEVAQLDLRLVQLASLSACETGLGEAVNGEGVLGLQRAFQVAGARSVIASLWSVDDNATRQFMERFYENLWKKNLPRLEALREAQLWMLKEGNKRGMMRASDETKGSTNPRTPPYFWAAFMLSGDWR